MANPHTDPMKYFKPALIIGGSLIGWKYVIAPTLEALGIKPDASDKIMDKVENYDINRDYWSANYYSQIPSGNEAIILTSAKANELAAQIKKAKSIFNDDESAIYAAFRQLKYKTQVSFLVYWFNRLYKEDLYSWLKDEVLNDEEMRVVLTITEKLPLGIRNVSTGRITGVGAKVKLLNLKEYENFYSNKSIDEIKRLPLGSVLPDKYQEYSHYGVSIFSFVVDGKEYQYRDKVINTPWGKHTDPYLYTIDENGNPIRPTVFANPNYYKEIKKINKISGIGAAPQNLVSLLKNQFGNEIKSYGITEIFVHNNELYITSKFDVPSYLTAKIENVVLNKSNIGNTPMYKIFTGHNHYKNKKIYRVESTANNPNEYVGEWHTKKIDAIAELNTFNK